MLGLCKVVVGGKVGKETLQQAFGIEQLLQQVVLDNFKPTKQNITF